MDYLNIGIIFFSGTLTGVLLWRSFSSACNLQARNLDEAKRTLREYGMTAELYLPTIGLPSGGLRDAVDEFTLSGYIVLDKDKNIVGKLVPAAEGKKSKPQLTLVVSND